MKALLAKSPAGLFATQTLSGHLMRGAVAFALLYAAIGQQHEHPSWSLVAGLLALVAMRGCPVCWTIGLVETIQQRVRSRTCSLNSELGGRLLRSVPITASPILGRTIDDVSHEPAIESRRLDFPLTTEPPIRPSRRQLRVDRRRRGTEGPVVRHVVIKNVC